MKTLVVLIALTLGLSAQVMSVKTVPNSRESKVIYNAVLSTAAGLAPAWGSAFSIYNAEGAFVLFMAGDTAVDNATGGNVKAANKSDSCLTVFLRIKDKNLGWSRYYNDLTTAYTRLDTVARSIINTNGATVLRMALSDFAAWSPGDSAQVGFTAGKTDSLNLDAYIQGF